jgi:hypothetical protein
MSTKLACRKAPAGMFGWPFRPRRSCYRSHSSCPCSRRMATQPTPLVYLAYVGAAVLVTGLLILGIGLLRARGQAVDGGGERRAVTADGR